jgi:hypothetical protein
MSDVSGVSGSAGSAAMSFGGSVSPDTLLQFCQIQLSGLDGEVNTQMASQQSQLREREAVEGAQQVLESYGTDGPQSGPEMQKCVDALNKAISQLPTGDPVAKQLSDFRDSITSKYGYTQAQPLSQQETQQMTLDSDTIMHANENPSDPGLKAGAAAAQQDLSRLQAKQAGTFTAPNKDSKEWQGTTDAIANIASDIKSNAELDMLKLQDLVSQRQQMVQLVNGVMGKEDQTGEDLAKAIRG